MAGATPLDERMRLHTPGQVTWPEPLLRKFCNACAHFALSKLPVKGAAPAPDAKGCCHLVAGHQGVKGRSFVGAEATACPQFREATA